VSIFRTYTRQVIRRYSAIAVHQVRQVWRIASSSHDASITLRLAAPSLSRSQGEDVMDKDRVAGSAKEIKGSIKETAGKALGDAKLQSEGKSDKAEGKVQNAIGSLKDTVREALDK
jgi:uncharacterized protein YjbJ (UPF0337 family)